MPVHATEAENPTRLSQKLDFPKWKHHIGGKVLRLLSFITVWLLLVSLRLISSSSHELISGTLSSIQLLHNWTFRFQVLFSPLELSSIPSLNLSFYVFGRLLLLVSSTYHLNLCELAFFPRDKFTFSILVFCMSEIKSRTFFSWR